MNNERVRIAGPAARAVDLLDSGGRKIGVASVIEGRIHAVVTDAAMIKSLTSGTRPPAVSIGYKVELATEPRPGAPAKRPEFVGGPLLPRHATAPIGEAPPASLKAPDVGVAFTPRELRNVRFQYSDAQLAHIVDNHQRLVDGKGGGTLHDLAAELLAVRRAARALVERIDDSIVGDLGPELAALRALVSP